MLGIIKFNFLKSLNLYMRILDADSYIQSCRTIEKSENKKILDFISEWLLILKSDVHDKIISKYEHPEEMNISDIETTYSDLNDKYQALEDIFHNVKYVPIQPPVFSLKRMVDEIYSSIPDEMKITNIYFKNITEFNFTESKMIEPSYEKKSYEVINKKIGPTPNVLSMTVIYHNNPLMWPLIFHEYGHTVFAKIKESGPYQKIYDRINFHCNKNDIIFAERTQLSTIISEVFSDIFAINFYSTNYFFAFYFNEILGSNTKQLLNLNKEGNFELKNHPPSVIRFNYMRKELDKKGYSKNNEEFKIILDYHLSYAEKIVDDMDKIGKANIELYELIFTEISNLFADVKIKIDCDLINRLHDKLNKKLPIGTSYNQNMDIKELLKLSEKRFDIETNNQTLDIIYTGWKYLILDMIAKLYDVSDYEKYLKYSEIDIKKIKAGVMENKMLKFANEYDFMGKNINYSIETSVIVSNYLED